VTVAAFNGASAIVSGGAGGLGEATVRRLHADGLAVVIADLAEDKGKALAAELGERALFVPTDATDEDSVRAAIDAANRRAPLRYAVIAHGGYGGPPERIVNRDGTPADFGVFKKTIELYLSGTYNVARLVAASIATAEPRDDDERGALVMTASIAGYEGQIGQSAYTPAKAGVIGLTLVIARDLGSAGIRVNTIAPGTMKTPIRNRSASQHSLGSLRMCPSPSASARPVNSPTLQRSCCRTATSTARCYASTAHNASRPNSRPRPTAKQYNFKMIRCLAALRALVGLALIAGGCAAVAQASPTGGDGSGQCSFVLTPPKVVQASGVTVVMAAMHPGPCPIDAEPNSSVVCLSIAGDGTPGQCASKMGRDPAIVYYTYQPGATYVVKGLGCASTFVPPYTVCQNFGPSQTTV
jgi:NAD(P)-dependent dehydrogenase (short-subunit alcohol dehydrogenase family)